jgi:hypothetical protein
LTCSLAAQSATLWLNPQHYKPLPSENISAFPFAGIALLPALRSICAGPVYPTILPAGPPGESFEKADHEGEWAKPDPPLIIWAAFSACHCQFCMSHGLQSFTNAGSSLGISLQVKDFCTSPDTPSVGHHARWKDSILGGQW